MARRSTPLLFLIWLCFALRLVFYAAVYPIWEGLDEWGHMAYVDHLRQTGESPTAELPVSGEIAASLHMLPLAAHLPSLIGTGTSHPQYWRLPPEERALREQGVRQLRIGLAPQPELNAKNYQAQHPPLTYRLLHFLDRAFGFEDFPSRVYALRLSLVAIASLCLPLLWMLAQRVFAQPSLVLPTCLGLALMSNFAVYVARVSNDGLALTLVAFAMVVFTTKMPLGHSWARAAGAGAVAGLAAIGKAYGVLLVPVYALAALVLSPSRWVQPLRNLGAFLAAFGIVAGWWFVPTFLSTGTLSGEALDVAAAAIPLGERLPNLLRIDWWQMWLYGSSSHIWIGGWSFLLLDEWLYWIFRAVGILALAGLLRAAYRRLRRLPEPDTLTLPAFWVVPLPLVGLFVLAIIYQGWQIFSSHGATTALGWYLSSVANAEAVVLVAGLGYAFGARHASKLAAILALLLAALDLFTVNFLSLPYYAGFTVVLPGAMPILSPGQWPSGGWMEFAQRLSSNHPPWLSANILLILWVLYLAATITLIVLALKHLRQPAAQKALPPA
ncbi:MAG: glycosyltransferase family 39 protein [Bryobacterales bacterium]|nr:glycosyltransferase family 39 protein [Bryobacterales bacterium]